MRPVLLDTNVLSELVRQQPDDRVTTFVGNVASPLISVLTLHELTFGAARIDDAARRARLMAWIETVRTRFAGRIINVDHDVPEARGNLVHDLHTAVLMREHGISRIVTRDRDFHRFPFLTVIDPLRRSA